MHSTIIIYTDGSCHTQQQIGAWSSIILVDDEKISLSGIEINTTHQRMELLALKNYQTKKGNDIANEDLVKKWLYLNSIFTIECIKIKAHQPLSEATKYNIEVDKLSRKLVRDEIRKLH